MIVPDEVRKCVIFVGYKRDDSFVKLGTSFFVNYPSVREGRSFLYLVTAKHIIAKVREKKLDKVYLRLNTHDGFIWAETSVDEWHSHSDDYNLDVSVAAVILSRAEFDYMSIPIAMAATQPIIQDCRIGIGEEVFLTGLFAKHVGQKKNVPILRTGTIALMADPQEPITTRIMGMQCEIEAHLIEARSIGGLSGSPVFVNLGFFRPTSDGIGKVYWLGLMHGHWDIDPSPDEFEEDDSSVPLKERVNMGIAIVIPSYKILEILEQPVFADMRKRQNERDMKEGLPTPSLVEE